MGELHVISSQVHADGHTRLPHFDDIAIKNEPMLFNCDLEGAKKLGGPITYAFTNLLPDEWLQAPLVIDSRVHMLMPGWYPCIPGWHHDDVPRTRSDGQPNYGAGQCRSQHVIALINGDICPTIFATGTEFFEEPSLGRTIYADWHHVVEQKVREGNLALETAMSNRFVFFDDRTWHRCQPANRTGWRFFIRASRYFSPDGEPIARGNPRTNEVRRQVQVYMDDPNVGW